MAHRHATEQLRQKQIVAIDVAPESLALAARFGATDIVLVGSDAVATVRELSRGGVDYAFEAVGRTNTLEQGRAMLAGGGALMVLGVTKPRDTMAAPAVPMLWNEWRILGSKLGGGPFRRDIPKFASLYLQNKLDLDTLISQRIALEDVNDGFARMKASGVARSVITFDDVLR